MKIFLSWSGQRSRAVAEALREWLPNVIQAVDPWFSAQDIRSGGRWNLEVATQLEEARYGIICLTPENSTAPWILYEAGALSKTLRDTLVCPYLFRMEPSDIPQGPLNQFQANRADRDGTNKLIQDLNAIQERPLPDARLQVAFEKNWPDMEAALGNIPEMEAQPPARRDPQDLMEEILDLTRGLARHAENQAAAARAREALDRSNLRVRQPGIGRVEIDRVEDESGPGPSLALPVAHASRSVLSGNDVLRIAKESEELHRAVASMSEMSETVKQVKGFLNEQAELQRFIKEWRSWAKGSTESPKDPLPSVEGGEGENKSEEDPEPGDRETQ